MVIWVVCGAVELYLHYTESGFYTICLEVLKSLCELSCCNDCNIIVSYKLQASNLT